MNSGERERESEKEKPVCRLHAPSSSRCRSQAPAPSIAIRDRELAFAPIARSTLHEIVPSIAISPSRRSRSTLREIAPSIAISRSGAVLREIAIDGAVVGLELAKHRAVEPSRALSVKMGAVFVFLVLSFPCSIFQTPENIFRKFFWNTTKHIKTFSFLENSISEKWNIFRKCFYANQTQPKCLLIKKRSIQAGKDTTILLNLLHDDFLIKFIYSYRTIFFFFYSILRCPKILSCF